MSLIANIKGSTARILYRTALWHLRYYTGMRTFPLAATFQLTNRCNLRCRMCNIPNNPHQSVLPLASFTRIVEELGRMRCCYASLSGGEVLTISNFFAYLTAAKANIPSVNTVTNGLLLDKQAAVEFKKARVDSVSISLDGMEETHELTRRKRGAFRKTVEGIENLKQYAPGVKIVVNTVIAPWNIHELKDLVRFVEDLGVYQKFQPLNEHPTFEGQSKEYSLEGQRTTIDAGAARDLVGFLGTRRNVLNSAYFLASIPDYLSGVERGGLFADACLLPLFLCEFREDGLMYPCLGGMGWKGGYPVARGVENNFNDAGYVRDTARLRDCRFCQKSFSVCYIEPRVTFPVTSFLRYRLPGRRFVKNARERKVERGIGAVP